MQPSPPLTAWKLNAPQATRDMQLQAQTASVNRAPAGGQSMGAPQQRGSSGGTPETDDSDADTRVMGGAAAGYGMQLQLQRKLQSGSDPHRVQYPNPAQPVLHRAHSDNSLPAAPMPPRDTVHS